MKKKGMLGTFNEVVEKNHNASHPTVSLNLRIYPDQAP